MSFIGNDIMYFKNNVNTFNRKGVTDKILSKNESKLFHSFCLNNHLIIAWTIKESIYKITCKEGNQKAFSPKTIEIIEFISENLNEYIGKAVYSNKIYNFKTEVNKDFVFSNASNNYNTLNCINNIFFPNNVSDKRSSNNLYLNEYLNYNNKQLFFHKNGVPFISDQAKNIDISITHDFETLVYSELKNLNIATNA
ncbi:MAG: 4-phosphopantetheinyl transferase family protein [Bacteroidia bacterium]|nr:4-phosphopantetheinyl transferase family protein [Bacteroidia bacterium]